ncbi:MAG: hypothetical protein V3U80_08405 [Flavobacteriaceae bacterium]
MYQKKSLKIKGKKIAVISYLTIIGLLIAYRMNSKNKSSFARYHIRQSLGILTIMIAVIIFTKMILIHEYILEISLLMFLLRLFFSVIGIYNVMNYERKPIPFIGIQANQFFKPLNR